MMSMTRMNTMITRVRMRVRAGGEAKPIHARLIPEKEELPSSQARRDRTDEDKEEEDRRDMLRVHRVRASRFTCDASCADVVDSDRQQQQNSTDTTSSKRGRNAPATTCTSSPRRST